MLKMKIKLMLKYSISCAIALLMCVGTLAQNDSIPSDSLKFTERYGLRLGADISKLVRSFVDDNYSGFEINGDYRITKKLYVAGEIGTEERTTTTDFLNSTAKGSYFKAGVDYNLYKNWFGMENMIYTGFRLGASTFTQTVNSYTIYNPNQTFNQPTISDPIEQSGLTGLWAELIIGIKAETISNLYIGIGVQFKNLISQTRPDNFENIYIPGFNRTYDSGSFGIGFNYNISYLIPLYKKDK